VVECLLCKCVCLSSNASPIKKKERGQGYSNFVLLVLVQMSFSKFIVLLSCAHINGRSISPSPQLHLTPIFPLICSTLVPLVLDVEVLGVSSASVQGGLLYPKTCTCQLPRPAALWFPCLFPERLLHFPVVLYFFFSYFEVLQTHHLRLLPLTRMDAVQGWGRCFGPTPSICGLSPKFCYKYHLRGFGFSI
jgi:hypothetical protein